MFSLIKYGFILASNFKNSFKTAERIKKRSKYLAGLKSLHKKRLHTETKNENHREKVAHSYKSHAKKGY